MPLNGLWREYGRRRARLARRDGRVLPGRQSRVVGRESAMTNAATASPNNFRAQLDGCAHERDALNTVDRRARAKSLLTQLHARCGLRQARSARRGGTCGSNVEGCGTGRYRTPNLERRVARPPARSRDGRTADVARAERQDADYVVQSGKIIDEVTRKVPDREQLRGPRYAAGGIAQADLRNGRAGHVRRLTTHGATKRCGPCLRRFRIAQGRQAELAPPERVTRRRTRARND